ncbi:PREDICTED: uncharacterized protein LOC109474912 isoform X2 [Branchiostoma belcheri]|uniref:Uncharacterized protein LOC109474912 isoform X2 n=1 Tax=Branchiostoma belcheri TaxID=7741 RepID=A0A6P4ZMV6_BRABE|nr:PREDICTED: uncharacterized protein LOC109474912 isoform X2 [Branchiostoma belcheri]
MAAVSGNSLWTTPLSSSSLLLPTTLIAVVSALTRVSATPVDCDYDQQFHVDREEDGDIFTNPCQYVEPNNQRHCHDDCSAKEANFFGKFTFEGGVEQCACKCRQNTHVFDVKRQVCSNTDISAGNYDNQTCQITVGDALYRTLEIPTGQSSVFLQPRIALHAGGNVVTQAESCQVSDEFYLDRRGVWPLNHIFSYSATSGPFFQLRARSDGYMYIRWMGPAHLSPCLDGLVLQLAISCNSNPRQTCVSFKLDGTAMYDYQSGSSPCLLATDSTGSGSGLSPMSRTHANPVLTSQVTGTPTPSRPPASNSNLAMIIGVAVGAVLALAVIGVSVAFLFYRAGKVAGRQRSTMRTNLPASARKKDGVANPAYSSQASQKGANVPPPVPPRPGEEPNYYSSADPEDIYMELDGTQQRSLYRKGTSQGGAYTSLNATSPAEKDKGDASKGPEPPAPPPVGSIPGYEGVYVDPQPGEAGLPADADYEGYIVPKSEENEYLDLNGGSSNL